MFLDLAARCAGHRFILAGENVGVPVADKMYRVSVVIPTYKRPHLLENCLQALSLQDIAPTDFEAIVVDDAASDATRQQVERWRERLDACGYSLRYLAVSGAHGPAAARNCGWRAARGEIIAFTDDDCLPSPAWLRAGLAAFG